jgi:DNA-binding PadR family transcriptional regulator
MTAQALSATEAGLLSVLERYGAFAISQTIDERNDPISVERRAVLGRLKQAGLVTDTDAEPGQVAYVITAEGRAALAELDARRPE